MLWILFCFRNNTQNLYEFKRILGRVVPIRAGIYDENGKLEKMYDLQFVPEDNTNNKWIATSNFYYFGRGNIRKIMKRMKSGKGYVRFLGELYNNQYFDINVKPYQPK